MLVLLYYHYCRSRLRRRCAIFYASLALSLAAAWQAKAVKFRRKRNTQYTMAGCYCLQEAVDNFGVPAFPQNPQTEAWTFYL